MVLKTAFLHMDRTEAIEDFAQKKLGAKIDRLTQGPTGGNLTFLVNKEDQIVKLRLKDKKGDEIALHAAAQDMYVAINKLANQLDKYLRRRKDKRLKGRFKDKYRELEFFEEQEEAALETA
ncbi:HPF/RaiA family ribosome-associated protein [Pseudobacteriovorax antillogorgiicola]|uniref:Ribosomal subunit interface protein n=1 Tax=Pseudobacteriovorax antillogorgiicola TaxID=1513793 RepID=A0A1Y6BFU9_9BACT|nr:HPF/RaiA family ribosome-associated protein [Pseudobacteriovorax antillogorgiicola]TCS56431.1 ribosomal subunit interface protein [Pseudobacteriovorax antillogorgiicola]SMF05560.1 ribosomal subunit interface protein [Pseudobacteriovorax antillogorgiicola]